MAVYWLCVCGLFEIYGEFMDCMLVSVWVGLLFMWYVLLVYRLMGLLVVFVVYSLA